MSRKKRFIAYAIIILIIFSRYSFADSPLKEKRIPETITPGIHHLLDLVNHRETEQPDMRRIEAVLDFIASDKATDTLYFPESISSAPSAYDEFDINQSLDKLLRYAYNPDIPAVVCSPSSVRLSQWYEVNGEKKPIPQLWEYLTDLSDPITITGVERIENTPDLFSGAYFGYDLLRTLILCKYRDRNVLISISSQKDVSDVGKKGLVVGSDDEWNYLYTGEAGLTKNGLGWIKSYIYSSFSIIVYMESADSPSTVRCGVFKWIRAGWAGINMVNKQHIREGIARFAKAFKQIIENPNLPDPSLMARLLSKIPAIPTRELRELTWEQLRQLKIQYGEVDAVSRLLADKHYVDGLTRPEMESLIAKAYVKGIIANDPSPPYKETLHRLEAALNRTQQQKTTGNTAAH